MGETISRPSRASIERYLCLTFFSRKLYTTSREERRLSTEETRPERARSIHNSQVKQSLLPVQSRPYGQRDKCVSEVLIKLAKLYAALQLEGT